MFGPENGDITERNRAERLGEEQRRLLECIATGKPLGEILTALTAAVSRLQPLARAGVLLADEARTKIERYFTSDIPASFGQGVQGARINELAIGTCSTAMFCGERMTCSDIANGEGWSKEWRGLCAAHGIRAVCSTPVLRPDGTPVASFFICFAEPREPDPWDLQIAEFGAYIAAIAIERDRANRDLGYGKAQLEILFNAAPLGVYLVDADFRIREANPVARSAFGEIPELIGRDFDEVVRLLWPKPDADEITRLLRHTLETGQPYVVPERIKQRLDGGGAEYYEWRISRLPLPDGRNGVVCYFRDVSAQVLARCAITESEERLAAELAASRRLQEISTRLMQEGNVEALYDQILDAAVAIMHSDMASMQMLDSERRELRLLAAKAFAPEAVVFWEWVRAEGASSCALALRTGERVVVADSESCDFMLGTPDLQAYRRLGVQAVQSTPLVSRSGRVLGMISTHWREPHQPAEDNLRLLDVLARQAADLLERSHAEAELRQLNESLEQRIAERTRELEEAMEQRRRAEAAIQQAQRLEAVGQLTGGVAHDFNNLLTVVMGQSEAIGEAATDDDIRRRAAAVHRAAERGARLTGQLLAFSRRQRLSPQRVRIERLMTDIDELVRRAVGETVAVEFGADPDLWPSLVDPVQFESAILNLAINAKDAMPEGGRLTILASNTAVGGGEALRLDIPPGDYVMVGVTDTGTGMPADVRDHAFEPFFTTKDIGKGTGLGLAQTYGFVRQSGGTVALHSAVGRGTTVFLYLPRAAAEDPERAPPPRTPVVPEAGHGKTILVVEDQPAVRDAIESSLCDLGYRVLTASDGVEAGDVLERDRSVDLLLTDLVMPNGISGLDLAERARRLRQDLKIVLVSGYSPDARIDGGAQRDGFVFLEKPFRQAELAACIAAALAAEPARQPAGSSDRVFGRRVRSHRAT
jgi:PAS domain S-box-containing protein